LLNISEGLFPDGAVGSAFSMTNWTPRAANQLGAPAAPRVRSFSYGEGVLSVVVDSLPGRGYVVEASDDLNAPAWTPLAGVFRAAGTLLTLEVNLGPEPQRFFRIRLQ
jgi:hypothetical protein